MGKFGLTEGTRHYIQFNLTGDGWQDLIHIDPEGNPRGLWCSHRITTAEARIQELMAECDTQHDQYRIVQRTFSYAEEVVEFDPNYGLAFNDPEYYDPKADPESDEYEGTNVNDDDDDDDDDDEEDEEDEPSVNTPVADPTK